MPPANGDPARVVAVVRGRVQAVGFRYFVVGEARRMGVHGFVRNLYDGRSVEVVAEGQRADLEALLVRLREGPPGAHVDAVDTEWMLALGNFRGFGVRA
jgi:acylphosphatase